MASTTIQRLAISSTYNKAPYFTRKTPKETALESLRRYNVYRQLLEAYQFVRSHPTMASILLGIGVCLHLPCIVYYSCYYLNFLCNIYTTVLPNLSTLFNFKSVDMDNFRPPWNVFLYCALNLVTCYLSAICGTLCLYVLLPIKGRYLATLRKQHRRRKYYCIGLCIVLGLSIVYQIVLSLHRNISFLCNKMEPNHLTLLSRSYLNKTMARQGLNSFWSLHAYQHVPCCSLDACSHHQTGSRAVPVECCLAYGKSQIQASECLAFNSTAHLLPSCSEVVLNITSDVEITMDSQMQLCLLISCLMAFGLKYGLHPHLRMLCGQCESTFGWVNMTRRDN